MTNNIPMMPEKYKETFMILAILCFASAGIFAVLAFDSYAQAFSDELATVFQQTAALQRTQIYAMIFAATLICAIVSCFADAVIRRQSKRNIDDWWDKHGSHSCEWIYTRKREQQECRICEETRILPVQ